MFSATRLIAYREAKGWSQAELARAAGVSHTYVQNLERGEVRLPKQPYLEKLAEALGVGPDDLLEPTHRQTPAVDPRDSNPAIRRIDVHLLKIGELDQNKVEALEGIIEAVREQAEREYLEEKRRKRPGNPKRKVAE